MRKKQDIMWEQSTLWESVEKWVTKYLKKNHSEYRELQVKAMRIVEENPALRILINSIEGIVLTPGKYKPRGQVWFYFIHKISPYKKMSPLGHVVERCGESY